MSKAPVYDDIKRLIRRSIENGEFAVGDRIPSEYQLACELNVSRHRTRQALRELEVEGYILRKRGSGSYVAPVANSGNVVNPAAADAVALVFPRFSSRYSRDVFEGFFAHISEAAIPIVAYSLPSDPNTEVQLLRAISDNGAAGLALWLEFDTPTLRGLLASFRKRNFPVVLLDRFLDDIDVDYVVSNNEQIGYLLTRDLIERGHRRIAFVGHKPTISSVADRYRGYRRAMHEAGLDVWADAAALSPEHPCIIDLNVFVGDPASATRNVMALRDAPTAFVCINDLFADWIYDAAASLGYKVPEDIALAAVGDYHPQCQPRFPLRIVSQRALELGRTGAEALIARMDEPEAHARQYIIEAGPLTDREVSLDQPAAASH